jgi:catechol 2,3-dioxygenase-like lactoylglutathione lyase family enzyme
MTRFHVHLNVADLATSLRFYTGLFGSEPSIVRGDYAKWMLDDPRINFAISSLGRTPGVDHVGFQVDSAEGLAEIGRRLDAAEASVLPEAGAVCCYARSDKLWTEDPSGLRWESFHTTGEATTYYGADDGESACDIGAACAPGKAHAPESIEVASAPIAAVAAAASANPAPSSAAAKAACCGPTSACC